MVDLLVQSEPRPSSSSSASSTWPWPSCTQPRTLSFRAGHDIFKTINSAYNLEPSPTTATDFNIATEPPADSFSTNSFECASFSTISEDPGPDPIVEAVTRGLRSERLFFEPGRETSSILEEAKEEEEEQAIPFKQSVVLSMDSQNPYLDFKRSMEEMVEAHGLKDWEGLEKLLCWYLKVNGKSNHGYIVGAFVDLLVGLAIGSSSSCSNCINSPSSPLSFYNTSTTSSSSSSTITPCISSNEAEEEIESSTSTSTSTPCSSSLLEAHEEYNINEEDDVVNS
ncbi:hypothetical protein FEM48_Zijuj12G0067900 [Ziziphus jujuba var. spinosa]|uniref:Transcription repressor n=1 Tax=Ziziphus jujuba var. spinosa TaxID=714518 RepID=A0A978UBT2_ZIZJJ|nr:hypothetical protein FEM48_Zijuj12G0067900 [Ziziphus jujuba var. spinosa]